MSVLNNFNNDIPEFTAIVKELEKSGVQFNWYSETPPHLAADSGEITQQLIIEKPGYYFIMSASKKGAGEKGAKTTAPGNHKIIPFPAKTA